MSDGRRWKWDYFTDMNVVQFLNYLAYIKDRAKLEAELMKEANKN